MKDFIIALIVLTYWHRFAYGQQEIACVGVANNRFVRNSDSCASYYACLNGNAISATCPEPYVFNAFAQSCDNAGNVDCTQCSSVGTQHIAHPTECQSYYRCVAGQRTVRTCGVGLLFDRRIGDCNVASQVIDTCQTTSEICMPFQYLGFLQIGDPNDCSKFYTCSNGTAFHHSCATNLYFNPFIGQCELPGSYGFCQGGGPLITAPWDLNSTKPPTNPPTQSTTTTESTTKTTTESTTQPQPSPNETPPPWSPQPSWSPAPTQSSTVPPPTQTTTEPPATTEPTTTPSTTTQFTTTTLGPSPLCERRNGYFLMPGSCIHYFYCINFIIRFEYECLPNTFFNLLLVDCRPERPDGCTEWLD